MHSDPKDQKARIVVLIFAALLFGISFAVPVNVKTSQLIRLFSLMLLCMVAAQRIFRNFGVSIASGATILLVGYRYLIGAGIGLHSAGTGSIASGFLYYSEDNFSYAAWAAQAATGKVLFQNLYTLMEHPALYFNPFFLMIGWVSKLLQASVIPTMIVVGILSAFLTIACVYRICHVIELPERASRWATLLASFSTGVSVPFYYFGKWTGIPIPTGADLRYMDSILFSTFYSLPYQAFAYALQAIVVLLIIRCEKEDRSIRDLALLGWMQCFAVFTRPYEWFLLVCGYGIYLGLSGGFKTRRLHVLAVLCIATAPGVLYNWWLSNQSVWDHFARVTLGQEKFRLYWLLGYGLLTPLAIRGTVLAWRNPELEKARWIGVAACLVIFLLMIFNIRQVKLASCGHLFLSIASGIAIHDFLKRINNWLTLVSLSPVFILLFGGSLFLMLAYLHADTFDSEILSASGKITPGASVLCDNKDGNRIPALTAARVSSGHWALTPEYSEPRFRELLNSKHFDFVLVRKSHPDYEWIRSSNKLIECYEHRCLFELQQ